MSSYYKSDLRCAEHPSAHESGIFELLGQLYPARLLFFLLKKRKSPKASKVTNEELGPNVLDKQRMIRTERLFLIPP